jgi:hypothetical protein
MIYTSYYGGRQIGTSVCISITQKQGYNFQNLPLFKPSNDLFKYWKASKKDVAAEKHYTDVFMASLSTEDADKAIDTWLHLIAKRGDDVTLNCHEIKGFCHRHLAGEIIKSKRPELWGGEVETTNKISISDASWEDIFGNHYEIIFDNRPIKEEAPAVVSKVAAGRGKR